MKEGAGATHSGGTAPLQRTKPLCSPYVVGK